MPADSGKIRELIQITKRYAGTEWSITACTNLEIQFRTLYQPDSTFLYLQKGIELARKQNNRLLEYDLTRSYARVLSISGNNREAIDALRELENKMPVGNELRLDYIAAWINWGKLDSAQAYINSVQSLMKNFKNEETLDKSAYIVIDIVKLLLGSFQEIIRAKKEKPVLLNEMGHSANNLMDKVRNRMKIDRERQFVQNKLIRNNLMLDIERGKLKQRFLWAGIIVLLVITLLIFIYQRKLLRKERSIQQAKEQLRLHTIQLTENESAIRKNEELISSLSTQLDESDDLKQEITQLNEENEALKEKNKTLQKNIEEYSKSTGQKDSDFDVFEKLAEQNARLQERERFLTAQLIAHTDVLDRLSKKPRYIDKSQRPEIIHAVNQLFDGYSYRLHVNFPALTEEDIFYCCLFKLRLSTSVVGLLMGISPSSVTKRKQRIKEKMIQQYPDENQSEKLLEIYSWN